MSKTSPPEMVAKKSHPFIRSEIEVNLEEEKIPNTLEV
jgi:hypothetical protein